MTSAVNIVMGISALKTARIYYFSFDKNSYRNSYHLYISDKYLKGCGYLEPIKHREIYTVASKILVRFFITKCLKVSVVKIQ